MPKPESEQQTIRWFTSLQVVVGQAEPRRLVAAQVRVDDVRDAHEVLEDAARVRVAQVERDAPLVAVEGLEEERVLALLERRHVAADVAAGRRVLDLDHLGAEVGELERPPRPGAELLDREHADVSQRLHAPPPPAARRPRARAMLKTTCCAPASTYSRTRATHSLRRPGDAVAVDDVLGEIARVARAQVLVAACRLSPTCAGSVTAGIDVRRAAARGPPRSARRDPDRDPAVAERRRAPDRRLRAAADPERRAARLRRPRRRSRRPRTRRTAPRSSPAAREQRPQRAHRLVGARAALARDDADRLEVLPALAADARPRGSRARRRRSRARRTPSRPRSGGAAAAARSRRRA